MAKLKEQTDLATMSRPAVHAAIAEHFGTSCADVDQAFTYRHVEALRSTLQTVRQGQSAERVYLLAGTGITGLATITLGEPLLCLVFGAAATWAGRALLRRSREALENSMVDCIRVRKERAQQEPGLQG
ncbi:MAG: hypothetical protein HYS17_00190 [Micavibrio aeruginosavorus]|uniref:Uncharacterized protein n=1 Tax=Micavibrio aeruginosavorus TaxID=349221 RepID=A0A7T5R2A1_9BACT|nr:MAG: hypothetical protein HYS17_00190 [Micavibrio aeruginosavorus]